MKIYNWKNGVSKLLCSVCAAKYPEKTGYTERMSGLHKCQDCKVNTATWWGFVSKT